MPVLAIAVIIAVAGALYLNRDKLKLPDVIDADFETIRPDDPRAIGILTVSGTMRDFQPAFNRPGCILLLETNGETGRYYVNKSTHNVRNDYPIGEKIRLRIAADAKPVDGVIDTLPDPELTPVD